MSLLHDSESLVQATLLWSIPLLAGVLSASSVRADTDSAALPIAGDAHEAVSSQGVMTVIEEAVRRGAPLYNAGDHQACADIYEAAARRLVDLGDVFGAMDRMDLVDSLAAPASSPGKKAWLLRRAFDRIAANAAFEPRIEASSPEGFPPPGPVGRVVEKSYPRYRAARADGRGSFWRLFMHIKRNDVQMTAPVEMGLNDSMRTKDMAFLYGAPDQGETGPQGRVRVLDLEPVKVLSVGLRGKRSQEMIERAREAIEAKLAADDYKRVGDWRVMGYNSPMVPAQQRFWELQLPVVSSAARPQAIR